MLVVSPSKGYEEKRLCVMWESRAAAYVFIVAMCRSGHSALLSFRGWRGWSSVASLAKILLRSHLERKKVSREGEGEKGAKG
jgi:hypothetical protein